jgi:hypothetical protein
MLVDVKIGLSPTCDREAWDGFDQKIRDRLTPIRIGRGLYLCEGWNPGIMLPLKNTWEQPEGLPKKVPMYGVCDTPQQVVDLYGLDVLPGRFVVCFVRIRKDKEPERDGWRWHKWGPYIGTQDPQWEYLYDEPNIEEVFTFHIYNPEV